MRTRVAILLLVMMSVGGCTPEEIRFWEWYNVHHSAPPETYPGFRCSDSTVPGESYCFETEG